MICPQPAAPVDLLASHPRPRSAEVTVVIPLYNAGLFLRESLESVFLQEGVALEVIVVDDGSQDEGASLACNLLGQAADRVANFLVLSHRGRHGPAAARDSAMRKATTEFALLLDADNSLYPRCAKRCLQALQNSQAAFAYPMLRMVGTRQGILGARAFDPEALAQGNYIDTLSLLRRSAWEAVGGFPHLEPALEDYALWLTLIEHGFHGVQVPEILATYRSHEDSRTVRSLPGTSAIHARLQRAFPWISLTRREEAHPDRYLELMLRILANTIYQDPSLNSGSYDPRQRASGRDWPSQAHSMVGLARLRNLATLMERTLDEGVAGDYIETGVWRGGCCILMRAVLASRSNRQRKVYVADSFAGLPPPRPDLYPADAGDKHSEFPQLAVSLQTVKDHFARYDLLDGQVVFVPGYFSQTLAGLPGPFALLRLDGDMYESTLVALESLYPRLSPGGFVIIDDYGALPNCRQAVDDYRRQHAIEAPMEEIDWTGVWWQKPLAPALPPSSESDFKLACEARGRKPDPLFFWYHTIDLGEGWTTPGSFDYRACAGQAGYPQDMSGLRALDIGSATGFWAFEMEKRGARVTSVELPSLLDWDRFPGESETGILEKVRRRLPSHSLLPLPSLAEASPQELHHLLLDGPFQFCRDALGSQVERLYSTIYNLPENLSYDWVMLGDVLLHTVNPLQALASAARVCHGTLVIADDITGTLEDPPALLYVGGERPEADFGEWWRPNLAWFHQVLKRLGFSSVLTVGYLEGHLWPGGGPYRKRVLQAHR